MFTKSTTTKHTCGGPTFGRKTAGCPRCDEMLAGAPAVKGWGQHRKEFEARSLAAIKSHNCQQSRCGVVCTFGDW